MSIRSEDFKNAESTLSKAADAALNYAEKSRMTAKFVRVGTE